MKALDFILKYLPSYSTEYLFEVKHGDHTCLVPFETWFREHRHNIIINYTIGHIGNSDQVIRIHPITRTKGKVYGH